MRFATRARIFLGSSEPCPAHPRASAAHPSFMQRALFVYPLSFQPLPHSFSQRRTSSPFAVNRLRTLFRSTEGGGCPPSFCLPEFRIFFPCDYPTRIVVLPARFLTGSELSESKDLSTPRQIIFINGYTTRQVYCLDLSPLFLTLTKTAGVYPLSSHSGTAPSAYLGSPHPSIRASEKDASPACPVPDGERAQQSEGPLWLRCRPVRSKIPALPGGLFDLLRVTEESSRATSLRGFFFSFRTINCQRQTVDG
jgi:hypothetical protein